MIYKNRDFNISISIDFVIIKKRCLNIYKLIYINSSLLMISLSYFFYFIFLRDLELYRNYNINLYILIIEVN